MLHDVVEPAHARVGDLAADLHLFVETAERLRGENAAHELERYFLAELRVLRAVNLPHPASFDEGDDAIAVREHCPRSKPGRGVGFRGRNGGPILGYRVASALRV